MNEQLLYEKCIESVQEACRKYWLEKKDTLFVERVAMTDIPLIGISEPDWTESFMVISEHYQGFIQTEDLCMVVARGALKDSKKMDSQEIIVDVSVLCKLVGDEIKYVTVHMTNPKRAALTYNPDKMKDTHYRGLLDHMYDLVMEYKMSDNVFTYSKNKFKELFHKEEHFVSIDQMFWHFCSNYVVEQDCEKMDMFRGNDIYKRLKNKDYVFETEVRVKRDDGIIWLKLKFALIPSDNGEVVENVFILINDITKEVAEKMENIVYARVDSLTQSWNRRYTEELVREKISKNGRGTFVIFDVDSFKTVNDTYGHITGDELLKRISSFVSKQMGENDVFGRLGGDEFILYFDGINNGEGEKRIADLLEAVKFRYCENDICMEMHCSAGVSYVYNNMVEFDVLYKSADKALYEAKKAGRNTYRIL